MVLVKPAIANNKHRFAGLLINWTNNCGSYRRSTTKPKHQPPEETANMMIYLRTSGPGNVSCDSRRNRRRDRRISKYSRYSSTIMLTNMRSISPTPRRPQSSPMFIFRAVSPPKSPNIARWLVKERNGVLHLRSRDSRSNFCISQPQDHSQVASPEHTRFRWGELQPPLEHTESKILVSVGGATTGYTSLNSGSYNSASPNTSNNGSQFASSGFEKGSRSGGNSQIRVTDVGLEWPILRIRCEQQ